MADIDPTWVQNGNIELDVIAPELEGATRIVHDLELPEGYVGPVVDVEVR